MYKLKRPNVLLIYTDQQRWDSLRCYGNSLAITPNLDRLASKGALLNRFFIQNPVCAPSRMSFLTGRYCSSLGVGCNGIPFPENDAIPIHKLLQPYGYHTAQIGKLHFQPVIDKNHKNPQNRYGFDTFILSDANGWGEDAYAKWVETIVPTEYLETRFSLPAAGKKHRLHADTDKPYHRYEPYTFGANEYLTHSSFVTSETCTMIENAIPEKPFFCIAGFFSPHCPLNPPQRFVDMYDTKEMPLPKVGDDECYKEEYLQRLSAKDWQEMKLYYMALVSHVDDCIGAIITTLEKKGIFEDTLILFTSDHGEYLGDHGRVQKGMPGHDCITRVPCIISYPKKIKGGTVVHNLIEAVDGVPTVLEYCGVQIPEFVQGKSLTGLLDGSVCEHRNEVLTEFFTPFGNKSAAIRTEKFKYYYNTSGDEILYDLACDPDELKNIVNDAKYKDELSEMRKRMIQKLQNASLNCRKRTAEY